MLSPTVLLATVSVIGHCLAIFWPRKPLQEKCDENGFPILWCNQEGHAEDVACVWREAAEQPVSPLPQAAMVQQRSA